VAFETVGFEQPDVAGGQGGTGGITGRYFAVCRAANRGMQHDSRTDQARDDGMRFHTIFVSAAEIRSKNKV
jgi:hypothetical protein